MDRPEIDPGARTDPDPPRGPARPGEPARLPPRSRLRRVDDRGDRAPADPLPDRGGARAPHDLERDRRARVRDPELLLAGRRGLRPARRVLLRPVAPARDRLRPHRAHARGALGHTARPREGGRRAGGAPGDDGDPADAFRDVDRRDPAGRGARARRERGGGARGRRRGLEPRRGAVRLRRVGGRRRGRRLAEGAVRQPRHRVRRDQRSRVGDVADRDEPALLLRLARSTTSSRRCRTPRTRGRRRSA